jgi:energy-coupling factor transporter ATP-binding protein EcfA2
MADEVDPSRHRTVVLIGRTGNGKSTCANVLAGLSGSDPPLFKPGSGCAGEIKYVDSKTVTVDWKDQKYSLKIVDTIGIGDTDLGHDQVLRRLATVCHECKEGIHALFFVIGGRITDEEADAWDVTWKVLFDEKIIKYTTFIRTKFPQYLDPEAVEKDITTLSKQKGAAARIIPTIKKRIIYVDNPPESYGEIATKRREESRRTLMTLLILADQPCKPARLDEVNSRIQGHVAEKSAADEKAEEMLKAMANARDELERARIEAAIAAEREKAARAEIRLAHEMSSLLQSRIDDAAVQAKPGPCSVM